MLICAKFRIFKFSRASSLTFTFSLCISHSFSFPKSFGCFVGIKSYTQLSSTSLTSKLSYNLKNQRLEEARSIFNKIPSPSVSLYTMMIAGFARDGRLDTALNLFDKMPVRDVVSWNSMIKGCLDCGDLSMAKRIFDKMPEKNVVSWTTIVDGFMDFGIVEVAELLFRAMPKKDVAAWNSMIHGYFSNGRVRDAIELFDKMPCRNVISWTSMIGGLDRNEKSDEALFTFQKMLSFGIESNPTTMVCVLTACAKVFASYLGVQIHGQIVKLGYCFDQYISASLITFYANCKQIQNACKVFHDSIYKNVVVWTALLTGYGTNHEHEDALKVFQNMMRMSVLPNQSSLSSTLNSCCGLEALDSGKEVHTTTIKLGFINDLFVCNSLLVMYTRCGNINDGIMVFKRIEERNIVSWNSVIIGCAQHGYGILALTIFCQMIRAKIDPDEITFTGLLYACSHSGMLRKGRSFFKYFSQDKSIEMKLEHYVSMVDLLGRCGKLGEAEELIRNMPVKPNSTVWLALLSACKMHSNIDLAERAAKSVFDLEPRCSAAYVLLSNLYASKNRWTDVSRIRRKMKHSGIVKQSGRSWVILKGTRHEFLSGDRSHPLSEKIYEKLECLGRKLKELGYVPDEQFALHDVEIEQKEEMLSYHSERLAIGFGLVSTVEGSRIIVLKNLRVCGDCHNAIKLIAKIVRREIVVRDSSRFHHFRDGACSCRDCW